MRERSLDLNHLPRLQHRKSLAWNLRCIERFGKRLRRRVDGLVRELERAMVMGERRLAPAIGSCLNGVSGVHVLVAHDPARFIGADRQQREPEPPMRFRYAAEMPAFAIAGIAD